MRHPVDSVDIGLIKALKHCLSCNVRELAAIVCQIDTMLFIYIVEMCIWVCSCVISWWHSVCLEFGISVRSDVSPPRHRLLSASLQHFVYSLQGAVFLRFLHSYDTVGSVWSVVFVTTSKHFSTSLFLRHLSPHRTLCTSDSAGFSRWHCAQYKFTYLVNYLLTYNSCIGNPA